MFFLKMLTDRNGNESSKRFIALLAVIQMIIITNRHLWSNGFVDSLGTWHKIEINSEIWWGWAMILCTALGLVAAEFFKNKLDQNGKNTP